jgi:hypothetical protein
LLVIARYRYIDAVPVGLRSEFGDRFIERRLIAPRYSHFSAVDDTRMWVGFTRIRNTLLRENVRWVKTVLHEGTVIKPTHIALFDLETQRCLKEIDLEPYGVNGVFGIFPTVCESEVRSAPVLERASAGN